MDDRMERERKYVVGEGRAGMERKREKNCRT